MKKLFSIVLVALLLTTGSFTSVLAEPDGNDGTDTGNTTEYWVQDIDPKTLDIHYLGEGMTEEVVEDEEPIYSDNDVVRVSIKLERPATLDVYSAENVADNAEAMSYRESLQNEQENITRDIESKINDDLDVQWNLTLAVNVISANVAYGDIEVIKDVSGVEDVFIETRYELSEDDVNTAITTEYMVGATQAWASGYTGAGSRVAIIDTGTNQDHISFDPVAFEYALTKDGDSLDDYGLLTKEEIAGVLEQLNDNNNAAKHNISSADYVYKNLKIPFAFNYIDGNNTTDHYSDQQSEHGSHVSGIAAANRYIRTDDGFVESVTEKYAVGVAPDAQILTMKVFGAGGGAYDSDYFAAIEDAIILKADSINLSLGSANPGSSFSGAYQNIMDNLIGSGSVVVMSAGNAYNWPNFATNGTGDLYLEDISEATGGSPGSFFNSIGVASAENVGGVGTPLIYNGNGIFYNESDSGAARMASIPGTYEFVYIDGIGDKAEYETVNAAVSLAGKIVIVNRGGLSFFEKGNNLIPFEPAALIVANNQKGTIGMLLDGYTGKFPMVSIVLKDANKIKATAASNTAGDYTYYTGSMEVTSDLISSVSDARSDAEISPFSSWGPTGSLIIKPEITAPGGNIWSVNGMTDTEYEIMGGTSMAAPHVTGMMAVLAQYVRENDLEAKTGLDERTLMHSLLMSTATPMIVEGLYLPVIEQGAGLGDVNAAINAKSYILMNEGSTIVPGSAKDGKVKAEFGQDAVRTGRYAYSFTINNFSDEDIDYTFRTDVFTQDAYSYNGLNYLDTYTLDLSANVSYSYEVHDVDRDGDTDTDDVQALLDYITGNRSGDELDLDAGEMDDRNGITSYDAQLLLECIQRKGEDILRVAAGDSADVSVIIQVTDEELANRQAGGYVEGFTYITSVADEEGAIPDVEHSIPFLGFYGSWTDGGMVDATSVMELLYPTGKVSYFGGTSVTNYMELKYPEMLEKIPFTGNPYVIEEEYPYDRLAISNGTIVSRFVNTYIRNIGTNVPVVLDENGDLIDSGSNRSNLYGAYYHVNQGVWMNTGTTATPYNRKVAELGLSEGDEITIANFAIPEYYALLLDPNAKNPGISTEQVIDLYKDGELGDGSHLGYRMTIDDTTPELNVVYNEEEKKISVSASDNHYLAYLAMTDVSGEIVYDGFVPEQDQENETIEYVFDLSDVEDNAVVIFAGDYAANEKARLVRIGDGPIIRKIYIPIFRRVNSISPDTNFVISNIGEAGSGYALISQRQDYYTSSKALTVLHDDEIGEYFLQSDASEDMIWIANNSNNPGTFTFQNLADGGWLGYNRTNEPFVSWSNAGYADSFTYRNNRLMIGRNGMFYNGGYFMYGAAQNIYLYAEDVLVIYEEVDPDNAGSVTLNEEEATLVLGIEGLDELQLYATVEPNFIEDRTVSWSSSDESIATVDENGFVKAVGTGDAVITAASNQTPSVTGKALIHVTERTPVDAMVFAQVTYGDDAYEFDAIDLNTMSTIQIGEAIYPFYGGGESGDYIYGNDLDNDYYRYVIGENGIEYDGSFASFSIIDQYALVDGANIPSFTLNADSETPAEFDFDVIGFGKGGYLQLMKDSSLNYFDMSDVGQFVAIAFAGIDATAQGTLGLYYYALTSDGRLYVILLTGLVSEEGEADFELRYGEIGPIGVLPMGEDITAFSMTYGGYRAQKESVIISDNNNKSIWYVDLSEEAESFDAQFVGQVEGAEYLSTMFDLYFDGADDLNSVVSEKYADVLANSVVLHSRKVESFAAPETPEETAEPVETSVPEEEPVFVPEEPVEEALIVDELIVETPVDERPVIEDPIIEDPTPAEEPGVIDGSLNAVRFAYGRKTDIEKQRVIYPEKTITVATDSGNASVVYSEDVDVNNGYIVVNYDPALAEYVDYSSNVDFDSVNVDQTNGVIRFACASLNEVEAGDAVAEFKFKTTCDDSSVSMTTKERNDEIDLNEESTETIKGTGHNYYLSAWIWEEDYSGAKVYFTCKNSSDHREVIPAVVTKTTIEPTADRAGQIVYLASAWFMGREYTDTRTIILPPTGSGSGSETVYEFVGFEWSDDYSKAYAIFKDPVTGKTTRIEAGISEVRVEPTVNEDGSVTYTATVVYDGKTYTDTKTVVLEKLDGDGSVTPGEKDDDMSETAPEQKDDKNEDAVVPEDQNKDADKKKTLSILDAVFCLATLGLGIYMALKGGFIGLLIAALSLIGFFLTQSLSGSLIVADKWSILLGVLMIINIIQAFFDKKFRR